jgi:thiamine pyrophosphate-dependent acetolactate synthase large subunit-like protein
LIRKEAIQVFIERISMEPIVSANGFISRDLFNVGNKKTNFYMIGSMGLASSIGLGIALKKPKKRIFVFDGDGNILMNLGSLTTIGKLQPKNLVHIVFDNSIHESTGGQPTVSDTIHIEKIAKSCNYKQVFKATNKNKILKILNDIKKNVGPIMILVKIKKGGTVGKRISIAPDKIKEQFINNL